jgi:cell volume regulation protein A
MPDEHPERALGLGVTLGVMAAAVLLPGIPALRERAHGYTIFLAAMLALYAVTHSLNGNGAMAVLVAALLLGNASYLVPRLFPGARGEIFTASETTKIVQDQMAFLIKSFFFFLIGLMFPTDPRLIGLAALAVLFLLALRVPAVMLATRGLDVDRRDFWLLAVAIPRGLAAGVLATLPLSRGIPEMETLAPAIFAMIVFSVLAFSVGFSIVGRLADDASPEA